jgi:hypothetical protein
VLSRSGETRRQSPNQALVRHEVADESAQSPWTSSPPSPAPCPSTSRRCSTAPTRLPGCPSGQGPLFAARLPGDHHHLDRPATNKAGNTPRTFFSWKRISPCQYETRPPEPHGVRNSYAPRNLGLLLVFVGCESVHQAALTPDARDARLTGRDDSTASNNRLALTRWRGSDDGKAGRHVHLRPAQSDWTVIVSSG